MNDKNIIVLSAPDDTKLAWPQWDGYTPLWPIERVVEEVTKRASGDFKVSVGDVYLLMFLMKSDYDPALSKAQFELWQCEGMKKE